ncbi:unnamed protein product [Protopolystoma xenopodis]|uniref:Uncharacterized protein n=1 Tax=Protopolystoma xenopodis TaxID=117903 RepID=A0A448XA67_9PLAT|nr:unnamed protein product [Protopolystoma xenopodis]
MASKRRRKRRLELEQTAQPKWRIENTTQPLDDLQKKATTFSWDDICEEAKLCVLSTINNSPIPFDVRLVELSPTAGRCMRHFEANDGILARHGQHEMYHSGACELPFASEA